MYQSLVESKSRFGKGDVLTLVWDWFQEFQDRVYEDERYGDRHVRMVDYFDAATDDDSDPKYNIACLRKARRLSTALGEDLFTLWCDAWLGAELFSIGEYKKARELLAPAVLLASKPKYANTPQQIMVHVSLSVTFVYSDPIGYEKEARQLSNFVKRNSGEYLEHIARAWEIDAILSTEKRDWEAAEKEICESQQIIACYQDEPCWSYAYLRARIAMYRRDWQEMLRQADEGLQAADLDQEHKKSFLFMRACALAALGDKKTARTIFRRGNTIRRGISDADDYMLRTYYWLHMDDMNAAIAVRLEEQAENKNKGRYWEQFKSSMHLVELYQTIDNHREANRWLRASKKFLQNLRNPAASLAIVESTFNPQ